MKFQHANLRCARLLQVIAAILLAAGTSALLGAQPSQPQSAEAKVLGLSKVFAFTYSPTKDFDPKQLRSLTLIGPRSAAEWKYWQDRGVVMAAGPRAEHSRMRIPASGGPEVMAQHIT